MRLSVFAAPAWAGLCGGLIASAAVPAHAQGAICWQPAALSARPEESQIHKGVRGAYIPVPRGRPRAAARSFRSVPGVVRHVRLPAGRKLVALTFDLCEQPYEIAGYQGDIVDYLRGHRVPATFFAGGKWMLTHETRAQQIIADPLFELANHAWEHRNFRLLDGRRLASEIDGAQLAYERTYDALAQRHCHLPGQKQLAHQASPSRLSLFRFPFGACNPRALKAIGDRGLIAIQWDVSSGDPWRGLTTKRMVKEVLQRARSGSIIIFHANGRGWKTGQALPQIIAGLRQRGFGFATVSQMLAIPGARPVIARTCYDDRPGDSNRYDALSRRLEMKYDAFYSSVGVKPDKR
jgi:peptidoglycan-N-acetylglucosamine deacetylase